MVNNTGTLILRPKKASSFWLLLGSILFVFCGIWMSNGQELIGYLGAGFFALGMPVALMQMLPNSTYLKLNKGELMFSHFFRKTQIPWEIIDHFVVVSIKNSGVTVQKMVGINYVTTYEGDS